MTFQIYGLKFGTQIHLLYQPGTEKERLTDGLVYSTALSSLTPNYILHLYSDGSPYSDREKQLAMFMAETYLFAAQSEFAPSAIAKGEDSSPGNRVRDPFVE